jgi:hypothetical protein
MGPRLRGGTVQTYPAPLVRNLVFNTSRYNRRKTSLTNDSQSVPLRRQGPISCAPFLTRWEW